RPTTVWPSCPRAGRSAPRRRRRSAAAWAAFPPWSKRSEPMNSMASNGEWTSVCRIGEIVPDTGVCALVEGEQVAVFRLAGDALYAIDNVDPDCGAAVLARGLTGNLGERVVVASPIHKQH